MVPLWLDEGLAEYFEVPAAELAKKNPHHSAIKWNMRLGMVPQIKKLEAKHRIEDMGRGEYRYAWSWVHFMLHGPPQARSTLVQYLADIGAGKPPGQLSERLAEHFTEVEEDLVAHIKSFK